MEWERGPERGLDPSRDADPAPGRGPRGGGPYAPGGEGRRPRQDETGQWRPEQAPEPRDEPADQDAEPRGSARRRRIIELVALAVVVPLTVGLPWIEKARYARARFDPPEKAALVRAGGTGTLMHAEWRLLGRTAAPSVPSAPSVPAVPSASALPQPAGGLTRVEFAVEARPLDAEGVKTLTGFGRADYRVRDSAAGGGHVWTATGTTTGTPRAGVPVRFDVTATVPSEKVSSLVLEVLPSPSVQSGGARALLRFVP